MIDENQKVNDFLEDLWKISKKHGIWIGDYRDFEAVLRDDNNKYLGACWTVATYPGDAKLLKTDPLVKHKYQYKPHRYDWRSDDS